MEKLGIVGMGIFLITMSTTLVYLVFEYLALITRFNGGI